MIKNKFIVPILNQATNIAIETQSKYLLLEHVLFAFIQDENLKKEMRKYNSKFFDEMELKLTHYIKYFPLIVRNSSKFEEPIVANTVNVFLYTYILCDKCNRPLIDDENILNLINGLASFLLLDGSQAQEFLVNANFDTSFISFYYQQYAKDKLMDEKIKPILDKLLFNEDGLEMDMKKENPLEKYAINLTKKVQEKNWIKLVGREKEVNLIEQILYRKDKPNVILVGNQGIGKKKIVEGFASKLLTKYPNMEVYQLDMLSLMSNIFIKGELENRVKTLSKELNDRKAILVIDNISSICGSDSSGQSDVATLLKPMLSNGSVRIIGTSTFEDYRKYIEKDGSFENWFFKMTVEDATYDETIDIINNVVPYYEKHHHIKYTKDTIKAILELTNRYIFNKHFPDKAIDLLDMVGAYCKYLESKKTNVLMVQETISNLMNIPLNNIVQSSDGIYETLEDKLNEKIIGQEEAVRKVSDSVIISKSGLRESNKTAISLMFRGKSGTGKTELCRVLSDIMNIPLVRFDMSEFMEENSVPKLIGAPPGYKDAGNGKAGNGLLINAIDEHPYCILLLDEIEKAHPKIHNLLLQVMDNGRLTSSMGKSVSFENVFLIMTSNVGAKSSYKKAIGFGNIKSTSSENDYEDMFLPEFRNRIDSSVVFNDLPNDVLLKICHKFLNELKDMLKNKDIELLFDDDVLKYIVDKSDISEYGARTLKHYITNNIKNKIAKDLVFGKYKNKKKLTLSIKDDTICFGSK